jgi:hypothetical protein
VKLALRCLLIVLLVAALPMRGIAGSLAAPCADHHGGVAVENHAHEEGGHHGHDSGSGDDQSLHTASSCGLCASCCAGAGLLSEAPRAAVLQASAAGPIPFRDRRAPGFVPDHLDRPPTSL